MPLNSTNLHLSGTTFETPIFFPSISSLKTALPPADYLSVLRSLHTITPQFLVSAYDLSQSVFQHTMQCDLQAALHAGASVLLDSGNYEAYWKDDNSKWDQRRYHQVLSRYPFTAAFSFDNQNPPSDFTIHLDMLVERWHADQLAAEQTVVIPIVHETPDRLPDICAAVAEACYVPMVAVAERRLGASVVDRTRAVASVRQALNDTGRDVRLHILGTGNPISIALYAHAGADSFDGLEWCQTVVDHDTALLHHLSHACFFQQQTAWGDAEVSAEIRPLAHNLTFYADWLERLRSAIRTGDPIAFFRHNFPARVFTHCAAALHWNYDPS